MLLNLGTCISYSTRLSNTLTYHSVKNKQEAHGPYRSPEHYETTFQLLNLIHVLSQMQYGIHNFKRGTIDNHINTLSSCLAWFIELKMSNNKFIGSSWMFHEHFMNKIHEKFKEIHELFMITLQRYWIPIHKVGEQKCIPTNQ